MGDIVRTVTLVFGIVFLVAGILGFILNPTGRLLLGLVHINLADKILHLVGGAVAAYFGFARQYSSHASSVT